MIYGIRELVAWWSQFTLEPGDVLHRQSGGGDRRSRTGVAGAGRPRGSDD